MRTVKRVRIDTAEARRRAERLRALQDEDGILVLANPWDIGTARLFANLGFKALASTSAGLAFSLGRRDGDAAVSADETFRHVQEIVNATALPVSADLENGFGDRPEDVAETIARAGAIGLAGASIEDATYNPESPLYPRALAVERINAAVEAARALPYRFTLTARAENYVRGRPDLDDVVWRLKAYEEAGADVLYAPGLPDADSIRTVCESVSRPVNVVAGIGPARLSLQDLAALGVRRVTTGTSLARAALTAALGAAREILDGGTVGFTDGLLTVPEINDLIKEQ